MGTLTELSPVSTTESSRWPEVAFDFLIGLSVMPNIVEALSKYHKLNKKFQN